MRTQIWSCGGGTQSAAIAALICQGKLEKPNIATIVDTEREKSYTFEYLYKVIAPALADVGVKIEVIPKSWFATVDLYSNNGDLLLPVYVVNDGKKGKMPGYCSNEWKRRVLMRWLKKVKNIEEGAMWLGISTDEMRRVRMSNVYWLQHRYPLIELELSRQNCVDIVQDYGWPKPPRSSCWMCPHMTPVEWDDLLQTCPSDFQKAADLEKSVREKDSGIYFHRSCVPLQDILDGNVDANDQSPALDDGCTAGLCFV